MMIPCSERLWDGVVSTFRLRWLPNLLFSLALRTLQRRFERLHAQESSCSSIQVVCHAPTFSSLCEKESTNILRSANRSKHGTESLTGKIRLWVQKRANILLTPEFCMTVCAWFEGAVGQGHTERVSVLVLNRVKDPIVFHAIDELVKKVAITKIDNDRRTSFSFLRLCKCWRHIPWDNVTKRLICWIEGSTLVLSSICRGRLLCQGSCVLFCEDSSPQSLKAPSWPYTNKSVVMIRVLNHFIPRSLPYWRTTRKKNG